MVPAPGSCSTGQGAQDGCSTEQGRVASPGGPGEQAGLGPAPRRGRCQQPVPPQVDELYEGYCIQCRLRDGASNMQRAFSACPPSRASRESLQELGRSLQECTEVGRRAVGAPGAALCAPPASPQGWRGLRAPSSLLTWPRAGGSLQDMWLIEGALEVHLGEFHVRMKGNRAESACGSRPGASAEGGLLVGIRGSPHNFGFPLTRRVAPSPRWA